MSDETRADPPDRTLCPGTPKADWPGQWIWTAGGRPERNAYAFFRKRFRATGRLRIDIAADTRYELHLDGARIARGTMPCVSAYTVYDTHQIDVRPGDHVVGVLVHHVGEACATSMKSRPGLLVEIRGRGISIGTDSSWKAAPASCFRQDLPRMMSHFGFPEECDLRQWPDGWAAAGFDDAAWPDAEEIGVAGCGPWTYLVPRDVPLLESRTVEAGILSVGSWSAPAELKAEAPSTADLMAARARSPGGGTPSLPCRLGGEGNSYAVLDFSREVTGHLALRFSGAAAGTRVEVGYDETLDGRGLPDPRRTYVEFADGFLLSEGSRSLETFGARGFRYLLVDVPAGRGLRLEGASVEERTCPVPTPGTFRCSDARLDALYRTGLETVRLCMLDTYVDCPSRERVLWMDSYLEGVCSLWGMGTGSLWRSALYLFAQNRVRAGELSGAVKAYAPSDNEPVIQAYLMYYVCSLADYVRHTGDRRTGEALFDAALDQFRVLGPFLGPDGLVGERWPSWRFLDWSAMDDGGTSAAVNAVYLVMHRKAVELARILHRTGEAEELEERRQRLVEVFRAAFWDSREGLFVDSVRDGVRGAARSQLTNALAVWADVTAGEEARSILKRVLDPASLLPVTPGDLRLRPGFVPATGGIVPIGTPAMASVLARALFRLGMDAEAMDYLVRLWTPLSANGTFAEHFSMDANTSFCHGWSAAPVALLPRYVLGIKPLEPNWSAVSIVPHAGNLSWAEGTVPTPHGEIQVRWSREGGEVRVERSLPAGIVERAP